MRLKRLARPFEIKEVSASGEFSGYGSVFGVVDCYGDSVVKGAFAKSLEDWRSKGAMPAMLWQHDSHEPIGVWTDMQEDDKGLRCEGRILLEAGPVERRAYEHLKAKSVRGLSIGYDVPLGGMEFDKANDCYLLKQIDLWEVSPVTFPANQDAQVDAVKSAIKGGPREVERLLRDAGFSRVEAKRLMSGGFGALRDAASKSSGPCEGCELGCTECDGEDCSGCDCPDCECEGKSALSALTKTLTNLRALRG